MIYKLKNQQEKLLISERHEAWNSVARKLAHEIKNPLTPIQLTIDNIRQKYLVDLDEKKKNNFNSNLNLIGNQIKQIENLVNEFADFARMPKPLLEENDLIKIILNNVKLLSKLDKKIQIKFNSLNLEKLNYNCDSEQFNRAFFNLIKNSIESIIEKRSKIKDFKEIIDIEINKRKDYIVIIIKDHGTGFKNKNKFDLIKPYYTTKKNGSGLGLSIVNKIILDHNGSLKLDNHKDGALIEVLLPI